MKPIRPILFITTRDLYIQVRLISLQFNDVREIYYSSLLLGDSNLIKQVLFNTISVLRNRDTRDVKGIDGTFISLDGLF